MMDVPIRPTAEQVQPATATATNATVEPAQTGTGSSALCPELVWRQIRWPASEPGNTVQMPCPSHAHSGNPSEPYPASLACHAGGQWSSRVQAARCQSDWLRDLSQRLERGDSPVAALNELAARTRPTDPMGQSANLALFGDDLMQIGRLCRRLVDEMAEHLQRIQSDKQRVAFARQIVQVSSW